MPGGRPPKPTRIKELTGNPGKRPLGKGEVQPPPGSKLKCPTWLHKHAKAKWRELQPRLLALGLFTELDGETLAAGCQAWAELRLATETLDKEGRYILVGGAEVEGIGADGEPVKKWVGGQVQPHPAMARQRAALQAWKQFSALFGLSPSDRVRVKAPGTGEEEIDPLQELLNRARERSAN